MLSNQIQPTQAKFSWIDCAASGTLRKLRPTCSMSVMLSGVIGPFGVKLLGQLFRPAGVCVLSLKLACFVSITSYGNCRIWRRSSESDQKFRKVLGDLDFRSIPASSHSIHVITFSSEDDGLCCSWICQALVEYVYIACETFCVIGTSFFKRRLMPGCSQSLL